MLITYGPFVIWTFLFWLACENPDDRDTLGSLIQLLTVIPIAFEFRDRLANVFNIHGAAHAQNGRTEAY